MQDIAALWDMTLRHDFTVFIAKVSSRRSLLYHGVSVD